MMRRIVATALVAWFVLCPAGALAAAAHPRASLTDIENDVMCPSCRESLAVAESPQAYAERDYIRALIAQGLNKRQIERELVAQYGPAVLAKPPAHGFDLTVYLIPAAVVLAGLATLAVVLPRWRRTRQDMPRASAPPLSTAQASRLDEELSRFDG